MINRLAHLHQRIARLERRGGAFKNFALDTIDKYKKSLIKAWGGNPNDIEAEFWYENLQGLDIEAALRDAPNPAVKKLIQKIVKEVEEENEDLFDNPPF